MLASQILALGTMAVAAGVIADALMIAVAASFEMAAQDACPAQLDGAHQPELICG